MRSTMAGRAPATTSGTFVFTCAATGKRPIAGASNAARMATRRADMDGSFISMIVRRDARTYAMESDDSTLALLLQVLADQRERSTARSREGAQRAAATHTQRLSEE